ncbi:hypothetical protein E8F11_06310 [Pseudomonas sp. BN417]|uniref:DUF6680 family protein n=1 Tax=Pseudomonas sp. BN417 TaxID=2567890 RepID=UPI0024551880|nr:DUF6680 family protein [Pseudomonas sp. BN417]MDH4554792.1 hypothetical protein [Pseudomonas sp. BN417]
MDKITISDWLMMFVVLAGPIIAVQLTRYLDSRNEIQGRKLQIFKTLMATRAYTISWHHVEALNSIDLEFNQKNKKEKQVIEAWKQYLDHLGLDKMDPDQWAIRRVDLFVELLHKMAIVLKYDFDKTHIKNSSYAPRAHGDIENEQGNMRKMAIELLEGKRVLPLYVTNLNGQGEQAAIPEPKGD